ncbi:phospholipid phosphatase-related protein type 5-like isoform X3 [Asterias rubens]|uniref:phospholipid phosphatase-related protein type 5-like isoform X3 n=1 Tax=Asterias rubens TaxID=7604 RepID=UPI0014556173|nr:phospholipid phosphatase-related protein type 5-like isoform X3 [Asterias rubens]
MKTRYLTVVNNALIPCFFFVDCLLLAGIVALWYFMVFWNGDVFFTNSRYILCSDVPFYSFPILESRVPDIVVYVLCFVMPPVVILFGEAALAVFQLQGHENPVFEKTVETFDIRFHPIVRRTLRYIGLFALGGFLTWILARTTQLILGYPTPYFFSMCVLPSTSCTGISLVTQLPECPADTDKLARQSFPSLFAALSSYSAVYTGIYITSVFVIKSSKTLKPLIFLVCVSLSYLMGLERLAFHKNSWSDVIAGWLLGGLIAAYLCFGVLNSFHGHVFNLLPRFTDPPRQKQSQSSKSRDRPMYIDRNMENTYSAVQIPSAQRSQSRGFYTYDGIRGRIARKVGGAERAVIRPVPSSQSEDPPMGTNYF